MTVASKYARMDIASTERRHSGSVDVPLLGGRAGAVKPHSAASPKDAGEYSFVLTLCSMAAPISLPQPRSPQLTRFTFFFTRRPEQGGQPGGPTGQYQLHMGYFGSVEEAQKWHKILAGIYPDAYVSEAPGGEPDLLSDSQVLRILQDARTDRGDGF